MIKSLEDAHVPLSQIHCVVGECDKTFSKVIKCVQFHYVKYSNIDNNAFIWISCDDNLCNSSWFVYLHDTCIVLPNFWKLVNDMILTYDGNTNVDALSVRTYPSMNIGLYRTRSLKYNHVKEQLGRIIKISKDPDVLMSLKKICK